MRRPLFSCVMPVKGLRPYMDEALASLSAQGMGDDLEVIIQDGDIEPDIGQSDALNKGFAKAKGKWFFWLNADDVLLRGTLIKVQRFINLQNIDWIAGNTIYIDEKGKIIEVRCDAKWRPWFRKHTSVWPGGPSAFFRRELWEKCGGFDTGLKYVMDIDLWTRWAKVGVRFATLGDYVWGFRIHDGSKTMGGNNLADYRAERVCLMNTHGVKHEIFWRNLARSASILDGSWFKRKRDSRLFFGRNWQDVAR